MTENTAPVTHALKWNGKLGAYSSRYGVLCTCGKSFAGQLRLRDNVDARFAAHLASHKI